MEAEEDEDESKDGIGAVNLVADCVAVEGVEWHERGLSELANLFTVSKTSIGLFESMVAEEDDDDSKDGICSNRCAVY